ncbi:MAG: hypothetical protein H6842_05370 [Rhodospirillaceae bacterium]|nr:hypothetical protein [Rhodospirillaceae bacterium]
MPGAAGAQGAWRLALGLACFAVAYGVLSLAVVPPLARLGGRVPLQCFAGDAAPYQAVSPLFCAANRHYVAPEVRMMVEALAQGLAARYPGTVVQYLDAGLPFVDGFPLVPHLSHDDGGKIDLAYFYQDGDGAYVPGLHRWPIGYWAFEQPLPGARLPCAGMAAGFTLRWDMGWLQPLLPAHPVDTPRMVAMLAWLLNQGTAAGVRTVLLEPHLADRWQVGGAALRFQGCRAARHDDHVHVSVNLRR